MRNNVTGCSPRLCAVSRDARITTVVASSGLVLVILLNLAAITFIARSVIDAVMTPLVDIDRAGAV